MHTYFKIDPSDHSIMEVVTKRHELGSYLTKDNNNGKPYIVPVTVTNPDQKADQIKTGPTDVYNKDTGSATRVYTCTDKSASVLAQEKIEQLEAAVTPRRIRDSILTADGKTWLDDQEKLIAVEREKL